MMEILLGHLRKSEAGVVSFGPLSRRCQVPLPVNGLSMICTSPRFASSFRNPRINGGRSGKYWMTLATTMMLKLAGRKGGRKMSAARNARLPARKEPGGLGQLCAGAVQSPHLHARHGREPV